MLNPQQKPTWMGKLRMRNGHGHRTSTLQSQDSIPSLSDAKAHLVIYHLILWTNLFPPWNLSRFIYQVGRSTSDWQVPRTGPGMICVCFLAAHPGVFLGLRCLSLLMVVVVMCAQSCPTLCNPMDCSPPGPSVRGILQARILEWVAISSSRGSSRPRDETQFLVSSCIGRWILCHCTSSGERAGTSYFLSQ